MSHTDTMESLCGLKEITCIIYLAHSRHLMNFAFFFYPIICGPVVIYSPDAGGLGEKNFLYKSFLIFLQIPL